MPEEINRLVTDAIADVLWTPSPDAGDNLLAEGVAPGRIDFVGNIMIDSYEMLRERIVADSTRSRLLPADSDYGIVTLHRPSNVDDRAVLERLVRELVDLSRRITLVFPVHPRTHKRLLEWGLMERLERSAGIVITGPLGYVEFMNLVVDARLAITDSGGIQEETTYLSIPCLTLRENTERPITVTHGSNRLVSATTLAAAVTDVLDGSFPATSPPDRWDGATAKRCVAALRLRSGAR
jgi:UDP-N-acetylglucosamine 2-epimerase (non-hydrolysing)